MPLIQLGLNTIPIDIELDTLNISSKQLIKVIKKHTIRMLFTTNLLGFCDDIDEIKNICNKKNILLIEDNCESLGTIYKGKKLGNFGTASTFSFFVGHHLSTIEGGMVCTNDEEIATMLKLVRAHGWDRNLSPSTQRKIRNKFGISSSFYLNYTFYDLGYNLRPTEINGFLGNAQLQYAREITNKRNINFIKFASQIYKQTNKYDHIDFVSNFAVPVICRSKKIRNRLIEKCKNRIEIRPIVCGNMVQQPFFHKYIPDLTNAMCDSSNVKLVHKQGLYFGNNPELTNKEIAEIINVFTK